MKFLLNCGLTGVLTCLNMLVYEHNIALGIWCTICSTALLIYVVIKEVYDEL